MPDALDRPTAAGVGVPLALLSRPMRGMTHRWLLGPGTDACEGSADSAAPAPLVQRILAARGLFDAADIQRFCTPRLTDLCDPELIPGIEAAAARLLDALRNDELIVIYGDYDVDGITATAILYHTLRSINPAARVQSYVPHRLDEGYGLNADSLGQLHKQGAQVVITVDCGITAIEEAQLANELGLDLIITDHHNVPPDSALPAALAIVHPSLPGSQYPFAELCGAGVAFKLAWRLATMWCGSPRVSEALQQNLLDMLPLAALGTIADVVPLVGENRVLASFGLRLIKQTPIVGLRALIEASDLMGEHIDCEKVGFVLGPRLNACGRMGHAAQAVRMLTDADADEASEIAGRLAKLNRERQQIQRKIIEQAEALAETSGMTVEDRRIIVLAHPDWHPGVVGIACSRLVEKYGRPTILMQDQGDVCRGSARSIDGYSIHDALAACAQHLQSFGGHDAAAGLTLSTDALVHFTKDITAHALANISIEQLTPPLSIDCDASLHELDLNTVNQLATLSPFGRGNRRPTLRVRGTVLAEPPKQMGAHGQHLQLRLRQDAAVGRRQVRSVWWSAGQLACDLASGMRLDVAIEPKVNTWQGRVSVEAEVRDVRVVE